MLRRSKGDPDEDESERVLTYQQLRLDPSRRQLTLDGQVVELTRIEFQCGGVAYEVFVFQRLLIFVEQIVHLPEFALRTCGFGGFRGVFGVRMRSEARGSVHMRESEPEYQGKVFKRKAPF